MAKARMKIVHRITAAIAVVLGIVLSGFAETVENVRGSQRENSKLVDIYYDLNDTDGGTYYVEVEVVGRTSDVNASSFSGDVGEGVTPGQNRHIVWDAGADWPGNKGDVKAVVTAIKGGKPNKVQLWEGGPYWADRNIGADNPWDYGLYFWWGDTTGHQPSGTTFSFSFDESNCPSWGKTTDQLRNEGWITSNGVLAPSHDAAHVYWGGSWRMPTYQELDGLCNQCDWTWTMMNGVNGYVVRGRDAYASNSIFLPCAGDGFMTSIEEAGWIGDYCSSTVSGLHGDMAYGLFFDLDYHGTYNGGLRFTGLSIRPVQGATTDKPLTLAAESADWTDGTIRLRCEDADTSGTEHEYYLSYYETVEPEKKWYGIEGATKIKAIREVDSNGNCVWVARLTDTRFAKRNMGLGTVRYRVNDENGRTAECETRKRHGLFVAVGEYEDPGLKPLSMVKHECAVFKDAYVRYGKGDELGGFCWTADSRPTKFEVLSLLSAMKEKVMPGDIFLFYFFGHGGMGYLCCYDKNGEITDSDLKEYFDGFCDGAGMVAVIYCCYSASMFIQDNNSMNLGRVGWILSSQADELTWSYSVTSIICNDGWFNGKADVRNGEYGSGNGDGYVTFEELAKYGFDWTYNNDYHGHRQQMRFENSFILGNIVAGKIPSNSVVNSNWKWLTKFKTFFSASGGDVTTAAKMPAANGCRTVGECYALGINPEDPNDDLKITDFKMEDGKPVITLNHTEDGSGNSLLPRVKTLGKATLSDAEEWREVPEEGDQSMRFFKVEVP